MELRAYLQLGRLDSGDSEQNESLGEESFTAMHAGGDCLEMGFNNKALAGVKTERGKERRKDCSFTFEMGKKQI